MSEPEASESEFAVRDILRGLAASHSTGRIGRARRLDYCTGVRECNVTGVG